MAEQVQWRYSKVVDGLPKELDVEAESFVLDALGKDIRMEMMKALRRVPNEEEDNLRLLHPIVQSMINIHLADDPSGRSFLRDLLQATDRVGHR